RRLAYFLTTTGLVPPGWPLLELLMRPVSRGREDAALQQYSDSRCPPHQRLQRCLAWAAGDALQSYIRRDERSRRCSAPFHRPVERLSDRAGRRSENGRAVAPLAWPGCGGHARLAGR